MDIRYMVIIALVVLSYFQYTAPAKVAFITDPTLGAAHDFISEKINFKSTPTVETGDGCPDTINKVCGTDGITYDNICKASVAGVMQVTPGECTT